jgi:glyoxylase-like metal-dependent hydrolase (beta-lactamase superfamily II)
MVQTDIKVKVLIEGYARQTKTGWVASSTVVYINDCGKQIIVDPGINKELLLQRLESEKIKTSDIDYVFLTHYHLDHAYLAAIFEKAVILDGFTIYKKDKETDYTKNIPGTNIQLIPSPGHASEHHSLLVTIENQGKIVVAGDVFWFKDIDKQEIDINKNDPFAQDAKKLTESRKKLLKIADWIIPGHGRLIKNQSRMIELV